MHETPCAQRTSVQQQQVDHNQSPALLKASAVAKAVRESESAAQPVAADPSRQDKQTAEKRAQAKMMKDAKQRQRQEGKDRLASRAQKLRLLEHQELQQQHKQAVR